MGWPLILVLSGENRDNKMAGGHADGANDKNGFATKFIDVEDCWDCGLLLSDYTRRKGEADRKYQKHDDSHYSCGKQGHGIGRQTETVEYLWGICT